MKRRKTKEKRQQGFDLGKAVDSMERIVSTALRAYRLVEPILKAIFRNGRKPR